MNTYSIGTGVKEVDEMREISLSGNVIPHEWYKTITRDNGKPYLTAIVILADIVYWYRPSEIRDEATGRLIGYRKKFKADKLQRSYDDIATQFGISKKEAISAVRYLETIGAISRDLRTISANGMRCSNVLFIGINPPKIMELSRISDSYTSESCDPPTREVYPSHPQGREHTPKSEGTYTEISAETTTDMDILSTTYPEYNNNNNNSAREEQPSRKVTKEKKPTPERLIIPPTLEMVEAYCKERNNGIDSEAFIDYYAARGWYLNKKQKMVDWHAAVGTWERNAKERQTSRQNNVSTYKGEQLVTINGTQYIQRGLKYYLPNGSGVAVDPYAPDDLPY